MTDRYLDFELQIERGGAEGQYLVAVVASPAGETQQPLPIPFPFDDRDLERLQLHLENALLRSWTRSRRALTPEEKEVRNFGHLLFAAVFQGGVYSLFNESRIKADHAEKGIRLKLRVQPPEFARLPWEFLLESRRDEYLCLSSKMPIVRYLELARPTPPLLVTPSLRILGMVASPYDLPEIDAELEKERLEQALQAAQQRGAAVKINWLTGQTASDLQRELRRGAYHIFHFIGHGSFDEQRQEGSLWLANEQGRARPLLATQLARLLGDHRSLCLAVLNACEGARGNNLDVFSSTAATLVRRGIPAVLAMQYEISDTAALLLAEWFYETLAEGESVDAAVAEARKAIASDNDRSLEWGTPVLFMRAKDGRIFDVQAAPPVQPTPQTAPQPAPDPVPPAKTTVKPPLRQAAPLPRPALTAPAATIAIPHIVQGASPHFNWCWIPGGKFKMGGDMYDDEKPIHTVDVAGFWLARYPVTNEQFRLFIAAGGYDTPDWWTDAGLQKRQQEKWSQPRYWQDSKWNNERQPVVGVSWYEAVAFCAWAADAISEKIQLPSEARWEKGARGTDGRPYPWGEAVPTDKLCNFTGNVGQTTPVGQYSPQGDSPYGCADMAGNVWEWSLSRYASHPYKEGDSRDNKEGTDDRQARGGSWIDDRYYARCAYRSGDGPDARGNLVGFRCASAAF